MPESASQRWADRGMAVFIWLMVLLVGLPILAVIATVIWILI